MKTKDVTRYISIENNFKQVKYTYVMYVIYTTELHSKTIQISFIVYDAINIK